MCVVTPSINSARDRAIGESFLEKLFFTSNLLAGVKLDLIATQNRRA